MKSPLVPQIENDNEVNVKENKVKKPSKFSDQTKSFHYIKI